MLTERTVGGLHTYLAELLNQVITEREYLCILDVGCGTGAWLDRVREIGFETMVGIDNVQPDLVNEVDFREFDIENDDASRLGLFDVVSCIEVIEHVENIGRLLDLIKISLAPRGVAIITTPNIESLHARIRALVTGKVPSFDKKGDPTHLCPILYETMEKMLHRHGLIITDVFQYPRKKGKTKIFGRGVKWTSVILRAILPDTLYGDTSIYVVKHLVDR